MVSADKDKIKETLRGEVEPEAYFQDTEYNIENIQAELIVESLSEGASIQEAAEIAGVPLGAALRDILEKNGKSITEGQIQDLAHTDVPNYNFLTPDGTPGSSQTRAKGHGNIINKFLKDWKSPEEIIEERSEDKESDDYIPTTIEREVRNVLNEVGISTYDRGEEPTALETPGLDEIDGKYIVPKEIEENISKEEHILAYLGETGNTEEIARSINEVYDTDIVEEKEVSDYLIEADFAEFTTPKNFKLDRSKLEYQNQPEDIKKVLETYKQIREVENA